MAELESGFNILVDSAQAVFSGLANKLIIATLILFIGFIAGRILGRLVQKGLKEIEINNILAQLTGLNIPFSEVASGLVTYFIYFIAVVMALDKLGLSTVVFNFLAIAVISVLILSFALTMKDLIPNLVAGVLIRTKRLLKPGDKIKFENVEGRVVSIDPIDTIIETKKKDTLYVPNAALINEKLVRLK